MASLARQVEPADPSSGVYEIAGSVFEKYRRHDDTTFFFPINRNIHLSPEVGKAPDEDHPSPLVKHITFGRVLAHSLHPQRSY